MRKVKRSSLEPICVRPLIRYPVVKQRQNILDWFSPLNFFKTQQDIFSRREDGTGQWFIESPEFQAWLSGANRALCCPGIRESLHSTYRLWNKFDQF